MKRVHVLDKAPGGLVEYLEAAGDDASWDGFGSHRGSSEAKRELRDALATNQHGLCAYCEIDLHPLHREIEHVVPRSDTAYSGASRALDPRNMLACCRGNATDSAASDVREDPVRHRRPIKRHQSCGQAKGDAYDVRFLDPRDLPAFPSLVRVLPNGEIEADEDACTDSAVPVGRVEYTINALRLNVLRLKDGRAGRYGRLRRRLDRYRDDRDVWRDAARVELLPDESNTLPRFFTTARSYLGDLGEEVLAEAPQGWI